MRRPAGPNLARPSLRSQSARPANHAGALPPNRCSASAGHARQDRPAHAPRRSKISASCCAANVAHIGRRTRWPDHQPRHTRRAAGGDLLPPAGRHKPLHVPRPGSGLALAPHPGRLGACALAGRRIPHTTPQDAPAGSGGFPARGVRGPGRFSLRPVAASDAHIPPPPSGTDSCPGLASGLASALTTLARRLESPPARHARTPPEHTLTAC